jgi:hypothetical protein
MILGGFNKFIEGKKILRMFSMPDLSRLSWDLGYFLYIVSSYYPKETDIISLIKNNISARQEEGGFRLTEDKKSRADFVRYNAHVLIGLSRYFWRVSD